MGKKNDVSLKEKYRLWWEYFKQSGFFKKNEEYLSKTKSEKEFFDWVRSNMEKGKDKNDFPLTFKPSYSFYQFILFRELVQGKSFDFWWDNNEYVRSVKNPEVSDVTKAFDEFHGLYAELRAGIAKGQTGIFINDEGKDEEKMAISDIPKSKFTR